MFDSLVQQITILPFRTYLSRWKKHPRCWIFPLGEVLEAVKFDWFVNSASSTSIYLSTRRQCKVFSEGGPVTYSNHATGKWSLTRKFTELGWFSYLRTCRQYFGGHWEDRVLSILWASRRFTFHIVIVSVREPRIFNYHVEKYSVFCL